VNTSAHLAFGFGVSDPKHRLATVQADWHGVAMVGTRMNNTGPAIRATAGYILNEAKITSGGAAKYIERSLASVRQPPQRKAA
jgi:hypothetical protein